MRQAHVKRSDDWAGFDTIKSSPIIASLNMSLSHTTENEMALPQMG
jgi:hypothetical protein